MILFEDCKGDFFQIFNKKYTFLGFLWFLKMKNLPILVNRPHKNIPYVIAICKVSKIAKSWNHSTLLPSVDLVYFLLEVETQHRNIKFKNSGSASQYYKILKFSGPASQYFEV